MVFVIQFLIAKSSLFHHIEPPLHMSFKVHVGDSPPVWKPRVPCVSCSQFMCFDFEGGYGNSLIPYYCSSFTLFIYSYLRIWHLVFLYKICLHIHSVYSIFKILRKNRRIRNIQMFTNARAFSRVSYFLYSFCFTHMLCGKKMVVVFL